MPELPEVETTRRGLAPHLVGHTLNDVVVRQRQLRWPVPKAVEQAIGHPLEALERRAKWLVFRTPPGALLMHLGMSGSMRVFLDSAPAPARHDHVDLVFDDQRLMRFNDPRRFGALLWAPGDPLAHPLLARLGPEPLEDGFDGDWLWRQSRGRRAAVKAFIMDPGVVVGVGNIYAAEALFAAGVHPQRAAGRIGLPRYRRLAEAIREVLARAIRAGGTTLRDFTVADGSPGYFSQELAVYGRHGEPCPRCGQALKRRTIAQRGTVYCVRCQR